MWGISKCKNDWILLLDIDERLSTTLKDKIHKIIENTNTSVFKIKRYESIDADYFTWQIRLFKKGYLEYLGITHEHPKIIGTSKRLNGVFFINHLTNLQHHRDYNKMDIFSDRNPIELAARDIFIGFLLNEIKSIDDLSEIINHHKKLKSEQTKEMVAVGKILRNIGLIKYLGLDKDSAIEKLNKKYGKDKQGTDLLIKILVDTYANKNI